MIHVGGRRLTQQLALTAAAIGFSAVTVACVADYGERVHIENWTDETVVVFEDGNEIYQLAPGDSQDFGILRFEGVKTYDARTLDGTVLVRRAFTWEEILREKGVRLIVQRGLPAQPSGAGRAEALQLRPYL